MSSGARVPTFLTLSIFISRSPCSPHSHSHTYRYLRSGLRSVRHLVASFTSSCRPEGLGLGTVTVQGPEDAKGTEAAAAAAARAVGGAAGVAGGGAGAAANMAKSGSGGGEGAGAHAGGATPAAQPREEEAEAPKLLADTLEAVLGAVFLDSGGNLTAVWRAFVGLVRVAGMEGAFQAYGLPLCGAGSGEA